MTSTTGSSAIDTLTLAIQARGFPTACAQPVNDLSVEDGLITINEKVHVHVGVDFGKTYAIVSAWVFGPSDRVETNYPVRDIRHVDAIVRDIVIAIEEHPVTTAEEGTQQPAPAQGPAPAPEIDPADEGPSFGVTIDVVVNDRSALYRHALAKLCDAGIDAMDAGASLRDANGEVDIARCLVIAFDPGESPPGVQIQDSSAQCYTDAYSESGTTIETSETSETAGVSADVVAQPVVRDGDAIDDASRSTHRANFMNAVRGMAVHHVIQAMNSLTRYDWEKCSKGTMADYYGEAKTKPNCVFPRLATLDLDQLRRRVQARAEGASYQELREI